MIKNNKNGVLFLLAITLAVILSFSLKSGNLDGQLVNLAVKQDLSYLLLDGEPIETKAILLDYADNQELVLASWLALKKYPKTAGRVFLLYAQEPEFKRALSQYGDGIIPVVDYFLKNEVASLTAQETASNVWQGIKDAAAGNNPTRNVLAQPTPQQRGWYAVNYINQDGYNFLGQFAIDKSGNAQWLQSDRATKTLSGLFTSGVRDLEIKARTGQEISNTDLLWAGADVFVMASSLKLLRAGKAVSSGKLATSGKPLGLMKRTGAFSAKLIKNKTAQGLLKNTAIGATVYIAIMHPSLINGLLDEAANALGVNPLLFKIVAWSILLFLLLTPLAWFFNGFLKPLLWALGKALRSRGQDIETAK